MVIFSGKRLLDVFGSAVVDGRSCCVSRRCHETLVWYYCAEERSLTLYPRIIRAVGTGEDACRLCLLLERRRDEYCFWNAAGLIVRARLLSLCILFSACSKEQCCRWIISTLVGTGSWGG